jgi:lipopolysaccharide export system permease protein
MNARLSPTLFGYLAKAFLLSFAVIAASLAGIAFIFDAVELFRKVADAPDAGPRLVLTLAALKLPGTIERILPFSVLFAAIHACWRLNRSHELAVIRAAGLSAWQFLAPFLAAALLLGVMATTLFNPAASVLLSKYDQMKRVHLNGGGSLVSLSSSGIWLRQDVDGGYALIRGEQLDRAAWRMTNVTVFFLGDDDRFMRRVDAAEAALRPGYWRLSSALVTDRKGGTKVDALDVPTALTPEKIEETFAEADTIPFWSIPEYIRLMDETGFPSTRLSIHFHRLLARPLLFAAMVLLAAAFSLRPPRSGGAGMLVALSLAAGFFVFFMESMLGAFGISQKIPAIAAAWTPAAVTLLLGSAALLHLEDG